MQRTVIILFGNIYRYTRSAFGLYIKIRAASSSQNNSTSGCVSGSASPLS